MSCENVKNEMLLYWEIGKHRAEAKSKILMEEKDLDSLFCYLVPPDNRVLCSVCYKDTAISEISKKGKIGERAVFAENGFASVVLTVFTPETQCHSCHAIGRFNTEELDKLREEWQKKRLTFAEWVYSKLKTQKGFLHYLFDKKLDLPV